MGQARSRRGEGARLLGEEKKVFSAKVVDNNTLLINVPSFSGTVSSGQTENWLSDSSWKSMCYYIVISGSFTCPILKCKKNTLKQ